MTYYEKLKAMTIEELANTLKTCPDKIDKNFEVDCHIDQELTGDIFDEDYHEGDNCSVCWYRFLKSEVVEYN